MLSRLSDILAAALQFVLLVTDLHNFAGGGFKVLLQLLELSALLEKSL